MVKNRDKCFVLPADTEKIFTVSDKTCRNKGLGMNLIDLTPATVRNVTPSLSVVIQKFTLPLCSCILPAAAHTSRKLSQKEEKLASFQIAVKTCTWHPLSCFFFFFFAFIKSEQHSKHLKSLYNEIWKCIFFCWKLKSLVGFR